MHEQIDVDAQITLTQAAKLTPRRPTANCVWRWCRKGVIARNGERVRLQHVRMGGQIFTTRRWLDEFGRRLAESDAKYFDLQEGWSLPTASAPASEQAPTPAGQPAAGNRRHSTRAERRRQRIEDAERELDEAGIR